MTAAISCEQGDPRNRMKTINSFELEPNCFQVSEYENENLQNE